MLLGIVKWRNEWWFSGVYSQMDYNADLILDEKNSVISRNAVSFLDFQENDMTEIVEKQFKAFNECNNGEQIAFLESDKIELWIKNYIDYFNASLKLSKKQIEKAKKNVKEDGFFGAKEEPKDFSAVSESGLVFFNPNGGVEMALAINSAFPHPQNSFYDKTESDNHFFRLLSDESISKELVEYCVDNFKSELPFFNGEEGKVYLQNIDFLIRYFKRGKYFTKPATTLIGKK